MLKTYTLFPQMKTLRKSTFVYITVLPLWKSTAMQSNASSLWISYTFHVMLMLVNIFYWTLSVI